MSFQAQFQRLLTRGAQRVTLRAIQAHYRFYGNAQALHERAPMRQPAVVLMSLPRSGSTWAGTILGTSPAAAYLNEPINWSYRPSQSKSTIFDVDPDAPPRSYHDAGQNAFLGWPHFGPSVVRDPWQWRVTARSSKRVVIKEVNPLAMRWMIKRFSPKIVILLRHPAGVAASFHRLNWMASLNRFSPGDGDIWFRLGDFQGRVLARTQEQIMDYPDVDVVHYEDLCRDPVERFRSLFDLAGLEWSVQTEQAIRRSAMLVRDGASPGALIRDSRTQADRWRKDLTDEQASAVMRGFEQHEVWLGRRPPADSGDRGTQAPGAIGTSSPAEGRWAEPARTVSPGA